jgi:hypothetical protein
MLFEVLHLISQRGASRTRHSLFEWHVLEQKVPPNIDPG